LIFIAAPPFFVLSNKLDEAIEKIHGEPVVTRMRRQMPGAFRDQADGPVALGMDMRKRGMRAKNRSPDEVTP